ncbi:Rv0909 family putative TA system antitoxin [Curtobacterium aurantiacum]|uniref:Antitoxin n=1 Tax=Curtobacterium aurantiacum TaxID=3236919 RepID=A0ABS5VDR6_9MICO|nr:Rv0909 family putative TA system antitoxin [Curtobacterium flaccumfaciens]MBT1544389.1 antitoxin [Curtobacterium flaccumfaciens pv. flaccumfaciens]MBT1587217.1 antitoxin [Curtobacterium flaccumfaciens pv. flaccumfaciens]MBT1674974.1 antitoxin [Curtobacterium flaccumfaciens pv. flaccumfaciens]MBT1681244.1 antitoxin [Curtobacterium flaccumfaciens pv. flaccumfaciens]
MAGFDDITKKAQEFLKDGKVQDALQSEKAEGVSDKVLGGVADAVKKATGGKYDEKIDGARDAADKKLGNE